jgi:hypothetical protein
MVKTPFENEVGWDPKIWGFHKYRRGRPIHPFRVVPANAGTMAFMRFL